MASQRFWTVATLLAGFGLGFVARTLLFSDSTAAIAQTELHTSDLHLEIEAIKGKLPDQSHAMQDVGYHFSNLWFAGQNHHWEAMKRYLKSWLEAPKGAQRSGNPLRLGARRSFPDPGVRTGRRSCKGSHSRTA